MGECAAKKNSSDETEENGAKGEQKEEMKRLKIARVHLNILWLICALYKGSIVKTDAL